MTRNLLRGSYPVLVGALLGLLQTGLFLQLSSTLSSGFNTFLLVTLCWLLGSAFGVYCAARIIAFGTTVFLALTLIAYAACGGLLLSAPFNARLWPVYAGLILLAGVYPGVFFARMSAAYRARVLFFRENNGFIAGLVAGTILFMLVGRAALWVGPLIAASIVYYADRIVSRSLINID
ncbi:MAG: hypothetical protein IT324_20570 [Anaerolineae bacterium]|nr:hypothetical protein [Anaerolineae bacterium]